MMTLDRAMIFAAAAISTLAGAADSPDRASPIDRNPACMDRAVDASNPDCVVKDDGTPRRTYPPKSPTAVGSPASAPAAPASTVSKSTTAR